MPHSFSGSLRYVGLILLVLALLTACSGRTKATEAPAAGAPEAAPTEQVAAEELPVEEAPAEEPADTEPTAAPAEPAPTEAPLPTLVPTIEPTAAPAPAPTVAPTVAPTPAPEGVAPVAPRAPASKAVELTRIPDTDPAPPLTIEVHTITIEDSERTRLTGIVRNASADIYETASVRASFTDKEEQGHGPVEAYVPCPYLLPGQACAFSLDIYGTDYVSYRLHPQGHVLSWGQYTPITVRALSVSTDGLGNVRITGTATNESTFTVRSVTVAGTLLNRAGLVVSSGWDLAYGELAPGASAPFDLRIEYRPYASYQLVGQAIRD